MFSLPKARRLPTGIPAVPGMCSGIPQGSPDGRWMEWWNAVKASTLTEHSLIGAVYELG